MIAYGYSFMLVWFPAYTTLSSVPLAINLTNIASELMADAIAYQISAESSADGDDQTMGFAPDSAVFSVQGVRFQVRFPVNINIRSPTS